jgi:hypothetical protein
MNEIRARRERRANRSIQPKPVPLPVRERTPASPAGDQPASRDRLEPAGKVVQFPRRDPNPPPIAA